jgi:hypothetical protein
MRAILCATGAVFIGLAFAACAAPPPPPLSPSAPSSPAPITPVATNPPTVSEPAAPPASSEPAAENEQRPHDLDDDIREAETVVDIAGALVQTPAGPIRVALARWFSGHAHARADALRARAGGETPERRDALVALGDSIDVFDRECKAEQIREDDAAAMRRDLESTIALSSSTSPPPAPLRFGRLAPEAIQIVIRASFSRFRACYEAGLQRNARLAGRVRTKFVIERDGRVSSVADEGSTLPDLEVVRCIDGGFGDLHFGPPRGGLVTVVYPIQFNPGD